MGFIYEKNRTMLPGGNGAILAGVSFLDIDTDTVNIDYTFVDDSLKGQGVAGELMEAAAKQLRETDRKAVLAYSYAVKWFEKHPEYSSMVKG